MDINVAGPAIFVFGLVLGYIIFGLPRGVQPEFGLILGMALLPVIMTLKS